MDDADFSYVNNRVLPMMIRVIEANTKAGTKDIGCEIKKEPCAAQKGHECGVCH